MKLGINTLGALRDIEQEVMVSGGYLTKCQQIPVELM